MSTDGEQWYRAQVQREVLQPGGEWRVVQAWAPSICQGDAALEFWKQKRTEECTWVNDTSRIRLAVEKIDEPEYVRARREARIVQYRTGAAPNDVAVAEAFYRKSAAAAEQMKEAGRAAGKNTFALSEFDRNWFEPRSRWRNFWRARRAPVHEYDPTGEYTYRYQNPRYR